MADRLAAYIARQQEWSRRIFGPGRRTGGISEHITRELREIAADPADLLEWIDVVILALDGAWRAGYTPEQIVRALEGKQRANMARQWPAPVNEDVPVEHVRAAVAANQDWKGEAFPRPHWCPLEQGSGGSER